jgi:hypothetical protein
MRDKGHLSNLKGGACVMKDFSEYIKYGSWRDEKAAGFSHLATQDSHLLHLSKGDLKLPSRGQDGGVWCRLDWRFQYVI